MLIRPLHRWSLSPAAGRRLQERLAQRVVQRPVRRDVRWFAGVDATITPDEQTIIAGVVVWDAAAPTDAEAVVERHIASRAAQFPYVPGLLSFRELPAILAALRALRIRPDVVLVDGAGLAHPRACGLACHLGLWLELPTVGCAKSRLCGDADEPAQPRGSRATLTLGGRAVGDVLRTRTNVKPLYVSPGHLCDRESAVRLTLATARRYRLPEPTRLAHQLVSAARARSPRAPRTPQ